MAGFCFQHSSQLLLHSSVI